MIHNKFDVQSSKSKEKEEVSRNDNLLNLFYFSLF